MANGTEEDLPEVGGGLHSEGGSVKLPAEATERAKVLVTAEEYECWQHHFEGALGRYPESIIERTKSTLRHYDVEVERLRGENTELRGMVEGAYRDGHAMGTAMAIRGSYSPSRDSWPHSPVALRLAALIARGEAA